MKHSVFYNPEIAPAAISLDGIISEVYEMNTNAQYDSTFPLLFYIFSFLLSFHLIHFLAVAEHTIYQLK